LQGLQLQGLQLQGLQLQGLQLQGLQLQLSISFKMQIIFSNIAFDSLHFNEHMKFSFSIFL